MVVAVAPELVIINETHAPLSQRLSKLHVRNEGFSKSGYRADTDIRLQLFLPAVNGK